MTLLRSHRPLSIPWDDVLMSGVRLAAPAIVVAMCLMLPALLTACSSSKSAGSNPYSSSTTITRPEMEDSQITFANAYEVVEHLRPQWLIKRGTVNIGQSRDFLDYVVVYEDRNRIGDPDALRGIAAVTVLSMKYLSPGEAIPLGPPDHPHGAIVVYTRP